MFPRVLHCHADYKWTGPSEPVRQLCGQLCARGWQSDLACMSAPAGAQNHVAGRAQAAGVAALEVFAASRGAGIRRAFGDRRRLLDVLRAGDYGLVHCHGSWDQFVTILAGLRKRVPVVRTDHAAREYSRRWLPRRFYGRGCLDHLIVLSDRYAAQAVDRLGLPPDGVASIRGAVDVQAFRPVEAPHGVRERLGLSPEDVVIGVVARVQRHRRFGVLLQAAAEVRRRNPRVKIAVCGRGTHKQQILDGPVARMGLADTVMPLGYRSEDYLEVLATFDAGLMLVPGSDGSCRAALQMAAMGKPLVVAQRGVLPDIVVDGRTGIVVDDEPAKLSEAILEMAADPQRRAAWGHAARRRMKSLFTPAGQAERVIGVYRRVLGTS